MPPANYLRKKNISSLGSCIIQFSFAITLLLFSASCNKKEASKTEDLSDGFKTIFNNVNILVDNKKPDEGIHYLDSAFHQLDNPTINDRFRFYGLHFVYYRKTKSDPPRELLYADSMVYMAQKSINGKSYVSNFAESNFARGDAYFDLGQYNNAYECFYRGYSIGKNHLDNSVLAEYTYRMGMVTFKQSHFDMAAKYFKESYSQSFAYTDDFKSFFQRQELLNNIGESYQRNGNIDSAVLYFNKTLAYINQNSARFKDQANMLEVARAVTYGDMGNIAYNNKQFTQAIDQFNKSIAINLRKYNDNYNAELVEINLGQVYIDLRKDAQFINLMQQLHIQLDNVKNTEAETDWNRLMSDYYTQKKDFDKALQYFRKYSSLKDSLTRQTTSLKEIDINQRLANYDKQSQIQNLRNDNKTQLIYLYLAVLGVTMAVIIIFLVYRNWKRSKHDVAVVSELNKQINLQKTDLENTLNDLKTSSEEKDRILRTVAHDLRNPIGGIASLTNVMLEDDELNEDQKELIHLINTTSYNSLELINEILEATDSTNNGLNKELVEINSVVNNSVEILSFKAAEKDQRIMTELLPKPMELYISQEKIWRVISNLISNAIKFSPNNALIEVKMVNDNHEIRISVSDSGIGIPDDIKDQIFNTFTNAKRPGTAGEKSFGLGLSICQQIVEDHDGKIWFERNNDIGTTFYVSLPAA